MFVNDLRVRELSDGLHELTIPLIYIYQDNEIIVPAGFKTDYASIPRLPIIYLLFNNLSARAATLHDYLYSLPLMSRTKADKLFLQAMLEESVSQPIAYSAYYAVRLFGKAIRSNTYNINNP